MFWIEYGLIITKEGLFSESEFNGDENSDEWEDSDEDVDAQECRSKRVNTYYFLQDGMLHYSFINERKRSNPYVKEEVGELPPFCNFPFE